MNLIYLALTLAILFANLAGLGQLCRRWLADTQLARAGGTLALCLAFFFIEHFVGLGRLVWLWPISTALSLWLLRDALRGRVFWLEQLPFALPFLFALTWRWGYPDITGIAEHATDLYFVNNYLDGTVLPPPDQWLPGMRFDFYYAFLHYAVALMARWLGLSGGVALALGGPVLFGFIGSLAWSLTGRWLAERWVRVVIVTALVAGGSGLSPLLPSLFPGDAESQIWASTRFIGKYDQNLPTPTGRHLFMPSRDMPRPAGFVPRELPLESPAYLAYLGDVHPPLGGFALLFFALALIARIERPERDEDLRPYTLLLGATLPLPLAINTWVFPLHVMLVLGWVLYRWRGQQQLHMQWGLAGACLGAALLYPFLSYFAASALPTPMSITRAINLTPLRQGLAVWWPVLWLIVMALVLGVRQKTLRWSGLGMLLLLLFTEFVMVNDPAAPGYERSNTVLKWWSWLYLAALVWLTTLLAAHTRRGLRLLALLPALASASLLLVEYGVWTHVPRPHAGRLQGDAWLHDDEASRAILEWLRGAPRGVVLESVDRGSYSASGILTLQAGQPSALGWPDHESQWRNAPAYLAERVDKVRLLYAGQLPDAGAYLKSLDVRYVVWGRSDTAKGTVAFEQMRASLASDYVWLPLLTEGAMQYGVFRRADPPR